MNVFRLEMMHWPEIRARIEQGVRTVILPVGSTEQHGPHLPLRTDTLVTEEIVERVASFFAPVFIGPTLYVGASDHHLRFAGTVSLQPDTLVAVLVDYLRSLNCHGFEVALMVSCHGGNFAPMARAKAAFEELGLPLRVAAFTDAKALIHAGEVAAEQFGVSPEAAGAHAGHVETSIALALAPESVGPQRERGFMGLYHEMFALLFEQGLHAVTTNGVLGDPSGASSGAGRHYLDAIFAAVVGDLERQLAQPPGSTSVQRMNE